MEEDIISQFPDEILQHILSFIDIHEVVETTFLSKRWKHLWRSLPFLRKHFSLFLSHRDATAPVYSLHLSIDDKLHLELVEECVLYAINHGVQSLRLHAPFRLPLRLPAALFTSTTLRELEIRLKHTTPDVLERFSLPNLKTLYLGTHFFFKDDQRMEPFAGLPELEKLSLRWYPIPPLVLKAPKLRVLELLQYAHVIEEISAPLLTSFQYEGYLPLECSRMNLPKLEQVYLDIYGIICNVKGLHQRCVTMLHQLGNATTVSLTLSTLVVLGRDGGPIELSPTPFPYLKCLKVKKGRHKVRTVPMSVMNYLMFGTLYNESLLVEFPAGAAIVVKQNSEDLSDNKNDNIMCLFNSF